jgi:O-methyltransferase involved in polyketide biosynthesis
VPCDLSVPGLTAALRAAGLDPSLPSVWCAEGLCYYISAEANAALLSDAAALCPPGRGRLVATHIPRCNLDANKNADPAASALARLFTVCVDDVLASGSLPAAGWGRVEVSGDLAEAVRARYGAEVYYPYPVTYSGGEKLPSIEVVLQAERL